MDGILTNTSQGTFAIAGERKLVFPATSWALPNQSYIEYSSSTSAILRQWI
jgi:hypothetical protein